jgi:hypothetical protein
MLFCFRSHLRLHVTSIVSIDTGPQHAIQVPLPLQLSSALRNCCCCCTARLSRTSLFTYVLAVVSAVRRRHHLHIVTCQSGRQCQLARGASPRRTIFRCLVRVVESLRASNARRLGNRSLAPELSSRQGSCLHCAALEPPYEQAEFSFFHGLSRTLPSRSPPHLDDVI